MKLNIAQHGRGILIATAALVIAGSMAAPDARAWQPDKPVEIIIPTSPGGGVDRTARVLQKILQDGGLVKVPVTVVNKPGAGGAVSLVYLNQHAGDGHHIAINTPNIIANDINGRSTVK